MNNMSILKSFNLINEMAKMKLKSQTNKLVLSYFWWVLEPLIIVSLFYAVFQIILQRGNDNYFIFLIVGKVIFLWFSKAAVIGSFGLKQNKGIIAQTAIPKWIFTMANVHEATYKSMISVIVLLAFLFLFDLSNPIYWIQLPVLFFITYIFIVSVALILSVLVAWADDFSQLISMAMMGLMFASGIFWDINSVNDKNLVDLILIINPVAAVINIYREVLINGVWIRPLSLMPILSYSIILLIIDYYVFKNFNNKITRMLFS